MKYCPLCRHRYEDSQNFCLDDGTTLIGFSAESQVPTIKASNIDDLALRATEPSPELRPTEASPTAYSPAPSDKGDTLPNAFRLISTDGPGTTDRKAHGVLHF